jgi:hypothetical protein
MAAVDLRGVGGGGGGGAHPAALITGLPALGYNP